MVSNMISRISIIGGESLDDLLSREVNTSSDMSNLDVQIECSEVSNLSGFNPITENTLSTEQIIRLLEQSRDRITEKNRLTLSAAYKGGSRLSGAVEERNRTRDRQKIFSYARVRLRQALNLADDTGQLGNALPSADHCEDALIAEIRPLLEEMHLKISSEEKRALSHDALSMIIHDATAAALENFEHGYLAKARARGKRSQAIATARNAPPALKFSTDDYRLATGRTERERMASVGVKSRTTWADLKKRAQEEDAAEAESRAALEDLINFVDLDTGEVL